MINEFEIGAVRFFNELGRETIIDEISWLVSYIPFMVAFVIGVLLMVYLNDFLRKTKDKEKGKWKAVFLAVIVALLLHCLVTNLLIKEIGGGFVEIRERPYVIYLDVISIGERFTDSSFRSGHMASSAAFLTVIGYFYARGKKKYLVIWGIMATGLIMAFSRLHNGMHYPSYVLFGALFGCFYGWVGVKVAEKFCKK